VRPHWQVGPRLHCLLSERAAVVHAEAAPPPAAALAHTISVRPQPLN